MGRCAKFRSQRAVRAACCLFAAFAAPAQGGTRVHYTVDATGVSLADAEMALQVTMRIDAPPGERTVFEAPVWTPGSYRLRDFPQRIAPGSARAGERALAVGKLSPRSWEVVHGPAAWVELSYRVTVRNGDRFLHPGKERRCLTYEGPAVYLYVQQLLSAPCTVSFALPDGWSQASALSPGALGAGGDGTFAAADYDVLADCMVKLGRFQQFSFDSLGAHFTAVVDDERDLEITPGPWLDALRAVTEEGAMVFGGHYPFPRYWFLFTVAPRAEGGGLEHLASTGIGLSRGPFSRDPSSSLGVCAHEFFHCWNVKRLRPVELGPFDYERAVRTVNLWWSEGVTDYYTDVILARAGLSNPAGFARSMAASIASFEGNPARLVISPERSSWTKWDPPAVNNGYTISYYLQGELLGFLLDLAIRDSTDNEKSLDDVMRFLLEHHSGERGFTRDQLVAAVRSATGRDFEGFWNLYVRAANEISWNDFTQAAGWEVIITEVPAVDARIASLSPAIEGGRWRAIAPPGGAAAAAGLRTGDELVQINGRRIIDGNDVSAAMRPIGRGQLVVVDVVRDGQPLTIRFRAGTYMRVRAELRDLPAQTPKMRRIRAGLLR